MEISHSNKTARDDEYIKAYLECHSQNKAAQKCGVGRETIARAVRRANITLDGRKYNTGRLNGMMKISDEQILQGISDGLTRQEIADKYGVHVENLAKRMKRLGVHAKYATSEKQKISKGWHFSENGQKFIDKHCEGKYEFLTYKDRRYRIRCKKCGSIIERGKSTLKRYQTTCECYEEEKREQKELREARIRLIRSLSLIAELKIPKKCEACGETFYSQYKHQRYCSKSCKGRYRGGNFKNRCKKYNVFYDPSVTPIKVFERDHYQCKICGLLCNTDDNTWNGFFGAWYPTVDHIIPLSRGGTHTWDNVQCAHARCNSVKRDLITV